MPVFLVFVKSYLREGRHIALLQGFGMQNFITEKDCFPVIRTFKILLGYFNELEIKMVTYHSTLTKLTNGKI